MRPSERLASECSLVHRLGVIARVAGVILVGVGLWDLASNLPFALLYLGA